MMQKLWNTFYLYHEASADLVLKEIVHPSVHELEDSFGKQIKFFFIRYFENGYHIRLRLFLSSEESPLFLSLLKKFISVYEYSNGINIILKGSEYIPEIDRYGNSGTIGYAESQFHASSRFILHNLVQDHNLTLSERYLLAMKTHLAFFKGMGISLHDCETLCGKFVENWLPLPFSNDLAEQEHNRKTILSAFEHQFDAYQALLYESTEELWNTLAYTADPFIKQFLEINSEVWKGYSDAHLSSDALDEVVLSFIHMTNNRLGIVNSEESYLLFLIMKTIPLIKDYDNQQRT